MKALSYILIVLLSLDWVASLIELPLSKNAVLVSTASIHSPDSPFEEDTIISMVSEDTQKQDVSYDCNAGKCRFGNCSHGFARMIGFAIELTLMNTEGDLPPYLVAAQNGTHFSLIRPPIPA